MATPRAATPAISAAASRRLRAAAGQRALTQAQTSACSGLIVADTLYSCESPSSSGTDTFTLTLAAEPDVLVFQTTDADGVALPITVTAPDGTTTLTCQQSPVDECQATQTGTYTVAVASDGIQYTLEYTALLSESTCPAISLSFASASVTGSLTAGQTGNCYSFSAASGDVLYVYEGQYGQQADAAIFDADGDLVCAQVMGACTLTGPAPYRVLASNAGTAESYELQIADLTAPSGCLSVSSQAFGQVPALTADLCSTLTVTAAASYQIYSVDKQFATQSATLYSASGAEACSGTGWACQLVPGTYSFVQDYLLFGDEVSTVFVATTQTRGCVKASDTSFASGDATGDFTGPGEQLCRTLPTRAGLSDYLYSQPVASGTAGEVLGVVDSAGTQVCPDAFEYTGFATCALTGTAPFRVILAPSGARSHVRLLVQRTSSTAGCARWKQSGYGDTAGAKVKLTYTGNARCFVIPAAGRSAAELVEDADLTDGASAALTVNNPSGQQLCAGGGYPTNFTICDYKAGVTYTALLVNNLNPRIAKQETYYLARRDVTSHAACSRPASTVPGGPTATFTLGSSIAARCFRVSAASADKLMFGFRESAPTDPSAFQTPSAAILVTNGSGTAVCSFLLACPAAGSTSYQVIALTVDYTEVAITARLDTWIVATSAGWAPACQRHQFASGTTSAAVHTTLTDSSDVYCGVVNVQPDQQLSFDGSDNAIFPSSLLVDAWPASTWGASSAFGGVCGVSGNTWCDIGPVQQSAQDLLIVTPFGSSPDPITFDMQAVCTLECSAARPTPVYKSISPAAQSAGPANTVVLTGTGLNFATPFILMTDSGGGAYMPAVPLSVNAAGTRLTLSLDTSQVPTGTYDISAGDYCSPAPCSDWLLNAYKVERGPKLTAGTRFVPLVPARILTTRTGLGARRAAVPAHGTITFPVTGRAGVPASGVAAVVLDVSAVAPSRTGYLTVFAAGRSRPSAQTADFTAGRSATGLVTVPVVDGRVAVYNGSSGPVNLTADVIGYDTTASSAGTGFKAVGPVRILRSHLVHSRHGLVLTVAGAHRVPAQGVKAVAIDVSVSDPAKPGSLIAYGNGARRPGITSLSFAAGQNVTELVIARVTDGKIDLYNASSGSLRLTADAVGYYSAAGSDFQPVNALRVMDTRTGFGGAGAAILPHAAATLNPLWSDVLAAGADVTAVVLNVTVLGDRSAGALTVFPDSVLYQHGIALPNSSSLPGTPNIAFARGQTQSNLVIVPTGSLVDFYNGSGADVQVAAELEGFYTG